LNAVRSSAAPTPPTSRFLKLFFDLLYHQFAWTYDLVAWIVSAGEWQNWVLSILADFEGGRVLELGFGPGHLQAALHRKGASPVGIDASLQMAGLALKRILRSGFSPLLVNGYAQFLPFNDAGFDLVLASFPTNYILNPLTISEAFRVLKPGGKFTVLPFARPAGNTLISTALAWLYHITGQAPALASEQVRDELQAIYLDPFNEAGFITKLSYRRIYGAELWVIHALKPI
jgi:ubiquinone/menaquinone biosynthesis C-methylase UbiE